MRMSNHSRASSLTQATAELQDVLDAGGIHLWAEMISEVFWMTDPMLQKVYYVSPAYERIWQRPVAELYANPRSFLDAVHPDDSDAFLSVLSGKVQGSSFDHEYRIVRPDGSIRWIWDRGFPIADPAGITTRYVGLAQDITERKLCENVVRTLNAQLEERVAQRTAELEAITRELRASAELLRCAIDASNFGLWDWELTTGAGYLNPMGPSDSHADRSRGTTPSASVWADVLHPDKHARIVAAAERQLRDTGRCELEFQLRVRGNGYH
jgi:PAS domain S-box-containing protein